MRAKAIILSALLMALVFLSCSEDSINTPNNDDPWDPNNPNPPRAPLSLCAQTVSETDIGLAWEDMSGNEKGFQVFERIAGGGEFRLAQTTAADVDTILLSDRNRLTDYEFKVRAFNEYGLSDFTDSARASTREIQPDAPTGLGARIVNETGILLTWADQSVIEDGCRIYQSIGDSLDFQPITSSTISDTSAFILDCQIFVKYYYYVRAYNDYGESGVSDKIWIIAGGQPPAAPSNLRARALRDTQVELRWVDNSQIEEHFYIYESAGNASNFRHVDAAAADDTSHIIVGRFGNTHYYYKICAVNRHGFSEYSDIIDITTPGVPNAPIRLQASALNENEIDLTWQDNNGQVEEFEIDESMRDSMSFHMISQTPAGVTSKHLTDRRGGMDYYYRVRAVNIYGISGWSNLAQASTARVQPNAPTNIRAQARSETEVFVSWRDNSMCEDAYELYKSVDDSLNFKLLINLEMDVSAYADTECLAMTTYYYRVRAVNLYGQSEFSRDVRASTAELPPTTPQNLSAVATSDTSITLTWENTTEIEAGFEIYRSIDTPDDFELVALPGAGATSWTFTNLQQATQYYYRIRAYNEFGYSDYTNNVAATTQINAILAFIADGSDGLIIVDVTVPSKCRLVGACVSPPNYAVGVAISGTYAFVADGIDGVQVVDFSVPTRARVVGHFDTQGFTHAIEIRDEFAYLADGDEGLVVLNISDPINPRQMMTFDTPGQAMELTLDGPYAFIADYSDVVIIDISQPGRLIEVSRYDTPGWALDVSVSGNLLCVAVFQDGFLILDITDPSNPQRAGLYDREGIYSPRKVESIGEYAYFLIDGVGLVAVDISDPRHPLPRGEFRTREQVFALTILGDLTYIVGWAGTGLQIVSVTNGNQLRGIGSSPLPEDGQGVHVVDFRRQP